jgi:hypothetical protein
VVLLVTQVAQASPHHGADGTAGGVIDANTIISQNLVSFTSLQEVVQNNTTLMSIARDLGAEAEKSKDELEAKYRKQWEAEHKKMVAETEALKQVRTLNANEVNFMHVVLAKSIRFIIGSGN